METASWQRWPPIHPLHACCIAPAQGEKEKKFLVATFNLNSILPRPAPTEVGYGPYLLPLLIELSWKG